MKLFQIVFLVSILALFLSSCGFAAGPIDLASIPTPDMGTDVKFGQYMEVTAPAGWNSFKTRDSITIEIRNITDQEISLEPNSGLRIFERTDIGWIEVKNQASYQYELITLEPNKKFDPFKIAATSVLPGLTDYSRTSYIRIIVIGKLKESDKTSKDVGTYLDVQLDP